MRIGGTLHAPFIRHIIGFRTIHRGTFGVCSWHCTLELRRIAIRCRRGAIGGLGSWPTLDAPMSRFIIGQRAVHRGTFGVGIRHFALISTWVAIGRGRGTIGTLGGGTALDTTKTRDIIRQRGVHGPAFGVGIWHFALVGG